MVRILVATEDQVAVEALQVCFAEDEVVVVTDREECQKSIANGRYDYSFVDIGLVNSEPGASVADIKRKLRPFRPLQLGSSLIVLTESARLRDAVKMVKAGASDYLEYPVDPTIVRFVIDSLDVSERKDLELEYLRDQFWQNDSLELLRTKSSCMRTMLEKVKSVAPTRTTILLSGESGTGKGVIAQLIHRHSSRSEKQFISVHCGAIPDTLIESELFGHERGSFTGAHRRKLGKFEVAQGGTIFLDEIGTVTPAVQIKLLQVLQERMFYRVGAETTVESDVRVIAATNADLKTQVEQGNFRQDLFYRLNVFPIELPPLRHRSEDIPLLAESILENLNKLHGKDVVDIHPDVLVALQAYGWPGNIRELENVVERAYILETSDRLSPESLPAEMMSTLEIPTAEIPVDTTVTLAEFRKRGVEDLERQYLKEVLTRHQGRINHSAQEAGVSVRQMHKLLTKYGIRKEDFKPRGD